MLILCVCMCVLIHSSYVEYMQYMGLYVSVVCTYSYAPIEQYLCYYTSSPSQLSRACIHIDSNMLCFNRC